MTWFDSHCHNPFKDHHQLLEWLRLCRDEGVQSLLLAGVSPEIDRPKIGFYQQNNIHYSLGLHPWWVDAAWETAVESLAQAIKAHKPSALGECGLDRVKKNNWAFQLPAFKAQLELATTFDLPVVVHSVRTHSDVLALLKQHTSCLRGVVHGFYGHVQQAEEFMQFGFYLGIGCQLLKPNAQKLVQVVKALPLEAMVLETDSPQKIVDDNGAVQSDPTWVKKVALKVAEIKDIELEEVALKTTHNAESLFR